MSTLFSNEFFLRKKAPPQIPDFLLMVDLPQAHPMDSADTLRIKASIILESFFNQYHGVLREQYVWWDIAQSLAQKRVSLGDFVTRDDLSLLVDLLQNPASDLYINALELLLLR